MDRASSVIIVWIIVMFSSMIGVKSTDCHRSAMTLSCSNGNFSSFSDILGYMEEPITYLRVSNSRFGSFDGLNSFKQLKGLRLSATAIGNFQLKMLKHLEELETLKFSEMKLVTFDLSYLLFNKKLEYLEISNNPGLKLVEQPELSLTVLVIRNCNLKEVPSALRNLKNLKMLLLENNYIDNATVVLEYFPDLVLISLTGNPINYFDEALQNIVLEPLENHCIELTQRYFFVGILVPIVIVMFICITVCCFCFGKKPMNATQNNYKPTIPLLKPTCIK